MIKIRLNMGTNLRTRAKRIRIFNEYTSQETDKLELLGKPWTQAS